MFVLGDHLLDVKLRVFAIWEDWDLVCVCVCVGGGGGGGGGHQLSFPNDFNSLWPGDNF